MKKLLIIPIILLALGVAHVVKGETVVEKPVVHTFDNNQEPGLVIESTSEQPAPIEEAPAPEQSQESEEEPAEPTPSPSPSPSPVPAPAPPPEPLNFEICWDGVTPDLPCPTQ